MTRLPFRLPEFAPRVIWSSASAREVWQPRIAAVSQAWIVAERESVVRGVRQAALQSCTDAELSGLMQAYSKRGLAVLPLAQIPRVTGYQSASRALKPGEPHDYKIVVAKPSVAAEFAHAYQSGQDDAQAGYLGTPDCCRRFFERIWKTERWMDTTVSMYVDCAHTHANYVQAQTGINLLWRWLGVRPVSHLPCSADCAETLTLASKCQQLLPEPARTWHREILSWPVRYTSLFGIAEITSPIHRMSVPTDALAERVEVRCLGTGYPAEGATGLVFPFRREAATEPAKPLAFVRKTMQSSDNGFSGAGAQGFAHTTLLQALGSRMWRTVVDLGAGNGALLLKVPAQHRIAVEIDPARAKQIHPSVSVRVADCTQPGVLAALYAKLDANDLVIAQRDRNPPASFPDRAFWLLSYSYEPSAAAAQLLPPADK